MNLSNKLIKWWKKLIETIQDILVPEDRKIQKLIDLDLWVMKDLLPKSAVCMKDVFVLFDYQNKIVKLIVKSIKYKNNKNLKERIAKYFYEEIISISSDISLFSGKPPIILPMPMSKKEKQNRGFNQCEEICREIKKLDPNLEIYYNVLQKTKETERQTKLSREEREINVKDSMCVFLGSKATIKTQYPGQSEGKSHAKSPTLSNNTLIPTTTKNRVCIIIDDVFTTGASFKEARRALLSSGAHSVYGLFIAH